MFTKQKPNLKIFTPFQVAIMTFVFGPLAGGLMSGLNYRKFNIKSWPIVLIVPTILQLVSVFAFIVLFPKASIPSLVFPIFSAVTYFLYQYKLYNFLPFEKVPESFLTTLMYGFLGTNLLYVPFLLLFGTDEVLAFLEVLT